MDNLKNCETLTKLDAKGIKKAFKDFANFDIDARNEIFKMQRANFHKLKERHKDFSNETLSQCSLVTAVREYIKSISPEEREMKQFSRQGKIERMLLERWSYIRKSKLDKKLSFVKIAKKLYEKYSIKVDQSYLYKIWKKVEGDL
ncbi:hypothetical protein [Aliarcobacter cryaerophilus]|jgi:hypothetical protein|uniref:hypothetical protein n=1 Tax=Aliarcobacter cryaerophilus TaxID=28198 RepID=UPI003BAF1B5C